MDSLNDLLSDNDKVIHKEKNQKKYNKTTGQFDNLKEYSNGAIKTTRKFDNRTTPDKQIQREANYIKNIHIDETYEKLKSYELIMDDKYKAWWCKTMHTLGVPFVEAQAHHAMTHGHAPSALFHFLINKAMNARQDPYMPRIK